MQARIWLNGKTEWLGKFPTEEEAAEVVHQEYIKQHGEDPTPLRRADTTGGVGSPR